MQRMVFILFLVFAFPNFALAAITLSQKSPVPALCDETATYTFTSTASGTIVYGGSCGIADKSSAIAGENRVTWTLANGVYSNCTITVQSGGTASNTLTVPKFESTSKYPVVFVHGLYGNYLAWSGTRSYLAGQGWKSELLIANSITESNSTMCGTASPKQAQEVGGWVDAALAKYPGFDKVDLVGHSRGGNNIMRGLWHGHIDVSKVRQVVTLSGANRDCGSFYPAIPSNETPGTTRYSVYYSDGDPDYDSAVDYRNSHVKGAYLENLYPLNHSEMRTDPAAMAALKKSLLGEVGGNSSGTGSLTAVIATTTQQGPAPLTLTFDGTKSSGTISSYKWTFGDGGSATGSIVSHTYQLAGTYNATLLVANTSGQSHQSSVTITVSQPEQPKYTAPTVVISSSSAVGVAPLTVQFDGSGSTSPQPPIVSYSWAFGDGAVAQGAKVSHTFTAAGTYSTTLTVTDSVGMTGKNSIPVLVSAPNQLPVSSFSATPLSGNAPLTVSFNGSASYDPDGSIKNYSWSFGNGATANGVSVEHTYTAAGNYTATLQVTDDKGATASSAKSISVLPPKTIDFELLEVQADNNWTKINFSKSYQAPIVVAGPPGYADAAPATIRIRNVTSTGFEVRIQEWDYLDGKHAPERFSFIVMEKGIYTLGNGTKVEAGSFTGSTSFQKIALQQAYARIPVILTQVTTYNETDAVSGRIRNSNGSSFEYLMQEQERNTISHKPETVSYIAWEPGKGEFAGLLYECGFTAKGVTQNWFNLSFQTPFSVRPSFIAGIQTYAEVDPAALRLRNLTRTGVQLKVEEEQSKDQETRHAAERVGYLSFIALP